MIITIPNRISYRCVTLVCVVLARVWEFPPTAFRYDIRTAVARSIVGTNM